MQIESVPMKRLRPHPNNVRQGDIGAISESLRVHGQYKPIVAQRTTGNILAGNHTYKAAQALKWATIDVVWADVTDDEAIRILLVDNRTSDLADYDRGALTDLLAALAQSDLELLGTGFDGDDIDDLLNDESLPPPAPSTGEKEVCPECGQLIKSNDRLHS